MIRQLDASALPIDLGLVTMTGKHIALVEDNATLRDNYQTLFEARGFNVNSYPDSKTFYENFDSLKPDIFILDITLDVDYDAGFEICQFIRSKDPITPIIFLTGRNDDIDKISGIRLGADDYLSKTTSTDFIVARIVALLRRVEALTSSSLPVQQIQSATDRTSNLVIDDDLSMANWKGKPLNLSLTDFWILRDLYNHAGKVRSHEELREAAGLSVTKNTITKRVNTLRDRFEIIDETFSCIVAEHGLGYRWVEGS